MFHPFQAHLLLLCFWFATVSYPINADPLERFSDCNDCPEMIELPMGSFMMGAPEDEFRRNLVYRDGKFHLATPENPHVKTDEGPQGLVKIDIPYALSKNEVTFDQWTACVKDGGCGGYMPRNWMFKSGPDNSKTFFGGNHPVVYVSYDNVQLYLDWLNTKLGTNSYRLPTEAEWEYAARAGTVTRFAQGDNLSSEQANFSRQLTELVMVEDYPQLVHRGAPVSVESLNAANPWGFRHMSGNVSEFTRSCYSKTFSAWSLTSIWLEKSNRRTCKRAKRGGSATNSIDILRVAWRGGVDQHVSVGSRGFRILKELKNDR